MSENQVVAVEQLPVVQATQMTPMAMLAQAVQSGMSIETIRELRALQKEYEADEARKAYNAAMTEFKKTAPKITKDKAVYHGKEFKYNHTTLANLCDAVIDKLATVGISHKWKTAQADGKIFVTCVLTHSHGHSEETPLDASPDTSGGKNTIQALGSTVKYLERYTLFAACGLSDAEGEDDGRQGKKGMDDQAKADWLAAIEAHDDATKTDDLWKRISTATTASRDVEAHDELRTALLARAKVLKQQAKEATTI